MPGDKKVTVEVSEALVDAVKELQSALEAGILEIRREGPLDWEKVEHSIEDAVGRLERDAARRLLQECDIDTGAIRVNGKRYTRVGRYTAEYFTKAGAVTVERSLYREDGKRNAKTVDTVSLRTGALDGWLPATVRAMAFLVQQTTSREAAAAAAKMGRLPYSRSSFERVTHQLGTLYGLERKRVEDTLIERYEPPKEAATVSVQLDRFAVAMEEEQPRKPARPGKKAAMAVKWRMAFSGTVTLHGKDGEALDTIRYGRMPGATADEMAAALREDVSAILRKRPDLKVVRLSDGGGDVSRALAEHINAEALGMEKPEVTDLVDIWHVLEKLAPAAKLLFGEAEAPKVLEQWKVRLLNSRHAREEILESLRASGKEFERVGDETPVHDAMTYLTNQAHRMDYADARKQGLPVGSGNVEATCKSLGQRMRRPGARWLEETGQHLLDLRALALSDRFDAAIGLTLAPLRATVRRAA
jgi:hypothetical protein